MWVVACGIVALAVAMGVGRFAFTPLLPLMLRDGSLNTAAGAEWAAANYVGYLLGALTASRFSAMPRRGLLLALLGVAVSTLAVAGIEGQSFFAGAVLRAASGIFSAWALVCTSSWGLAELARRQAPHLGAWIYVGVGVGIFLTGTLAWLGGWQPARWLWVELGLLAVIGGLFVWRHAAPSVPAQVTSAAGNTADRADESTRSSNASAQPLPSHTLAASASRNPLPVVLCYGTFGFGYIVPATFLPAMARQQVSDPLVFGLAWPLFGLAAALSVVGAARWLSAWPRRRVWALAQGTMALGTVLPLVASSLWALATSAVLVGGTFMVATMAGLQLAREQAPANPTPLLARMTVAFASGQILGPVLVRLLGDGQWWGWDALAWANAAATLLLLGTAWWLWHGARQSHA
jgi:MFS family permease